MDAGEVYSGGIIIPPYSTEAKQRNPLVRGYNFAREFLADNPLLTMLFIVTSCSLLTGAVALNVYGPLTFALFYVPVYAVCGTFLACLALRAMKPLANPLRNGIAKFMRRDDTSGFNEETYNRVLSSLRAMRAKKPRKVLHENRSNSQADSLVYDKVRIAAWDGDFNSPKTKHYAHHLAMLTYPGAAEANRAAQIIAMVEDRGLVTDPHLIEDVLVSDVPSLTSGQL